MGTEEKLDKLESYMNEETEVFGMASGDAFCIDGWFTIKELIEFANKVKELFE